MNSTKDISIDAADKLTAVSRRRRASKLDMHFVVIANYLARPQSLTSYSGSSKSRLAQIADHVYAKTGTAASKSAVCRFLKKHPLLKSL